LRIKTRGEAISFQLFFAEMVMLERVSFGASL